MSVTPTVEEELNRARDAYERLTHALSTAIVGQAAVIDQVLWGLLAGGHVLLEGSPGLGKTLLVRSLASCLELEYSRIQFTPDLMPSDIIGTNILLPNPQSGHRFELHRGPIFGQIVLADEINRATPKTQSALLEAMQEHSVTIAGRQHQLEEPFFVLATQNPIEMEGTYPLPEAQLDRFLLKVEVLPPGEQELTDILQRTTGQPKAPPEHVLSAEQVRNLRRLCREIEVAEPVLRYAARLVAATSPDSDTAPELVKRSIRFGASVRGAQALVLAGKAMATLQGRAQVAFADIRAAAAPVLRHRLIRSFEGEAEGISENAVIQEVLDHVPARPERVEQAVRSR